MIDETPATLTTMMTPNRRRVTKGLIATGFASVLFPAVGHASVVKANTWPVCGLDLSHAAFRTPADWDRIYAKFWGSLGPQTKTQIDTVIHNIAGVYDDRDAEFAWIVHYWIRAWIVMADLTGQSKYMDMCVSFIDYMLDHTDERRIERGEITERYVREPLYLKGTGRGGPIWKRGGNGSVLNTGQVVRSILYFVDAVFENPGRWSAYRTEAERYLAAAILAADAFDNDWQKFENKGSYHYRSSAGTGDLGTARTAFNQSATMVTAHLLINKWRPDAARADKVRRLAQYWIDDFAIPQSGGTLKWRYILNPNIKDVEDAGHAAIDLDFLIPAYLSGVTNLTRSHMTALAQTFLKRLYTGASGSNRFVDGTTESGFSEHYNAGFGWFELGRFAPEIVSVTLRIYNANYPPDAPGGVLWARPMLGWANLLRAARRCRARS
ncbi:MAG: hypothetical protein ACE5FM_01035 [Methyloligellaceae bacterium]